MANVWKTGLEIRFYSAWIGIPMLLGLFQPLTKILLRQKKIYKTSKEKKPSTSNENSNSDDYDDENYAPKYAPFILLFYAFGSVIFAIIHLFIVGLFVSGTNHFNITLNDGLCHFVYTTLYHSYNLSLYFYFMFMLYRIRIVFREPASLQLKTNKYAVLLLYIHVLYITKIYLGSLSDFIWNNKYNFCQYIIDPFILEIFYYVKYSGDSTVILLLSLMFIQRLFKLTRQNENVNAFRKRTIIFGLFACITSLFISIGKLAGLPTEYFVNIDEIINCFCVVFSYKIECQCIVCVGWKNYFFGINNQDEDEEDTYIQPPDDVVLEEIFGGDKWEQMDTASHEGCS